MKSIQFILPTLIALIIVSCGAEAENNRAEDATEVSSNIILVTQAQFEQGKMEIDKLKKEPFHQTIYSTGMFDVPPDNKSTVSAYFGGYVKHISLLPGQKVTKGQVLFTLENPAYIEVQENFLAAKSQLKYLKADFERQEELANQNVSAQKTFLKAESDYQVTLGRFESLKKKLQLMNIEPNSVTENNLKSTISITAPIGGFITSVLATRGLFLDPSDVAVTIMNTDHLHVELNIFEQDLTKVEIDQEVSFKLQNDDRNYKASVYLINKAIDPVKRTIMVHCHLEDEDESILFTPGMYVEAEIHAKSDSLFCLPKDAVVSIEDKHYILIKKNSNNTDLEFVRTLVEVGRMNEKYIEIKNATDLNPAELILTKGAFNLIQE